MPSIPGWQEAAVFAPFRAFVAEIEAIVRSAEPLATHPVASVPENVTATDSLSAVPRPPIPDTANPPQPDSDARATPAHRAEDAARDISERLLQRLRFHGAQWQRSAHAEIVEAAPELHYMFAALADDLLLNTEWRGQSAWIAHLLEERLFNSRVAGDAVFTGIDRLVRTQRASKPMLARLYLSMLALGYRGRYHGQLGRAEQRDQLAQYRRVLYEAAMQQALSEDASRLDVVDANAYAHTLDAVMPMRFRRPARWLMVVLIGVGVLLAFSELAWLASSWPVRRALLETTSLSARVSMPQANGMRLASRAQPDRDARA